MCEPASSLWVLKGLSTTVLSPHPMFQIIKNMNLMLNMDYIIIYVYVKHLTSPL